PEFDYDALTKNARGRRVFPAAPERSLLLQKATGQVPHGGGVRLELDGPDHILVREWIAAGLPRRIEGEPQVERVAVTPADLLLKPGEERQLKVTAYYSNGSERDVT